MLSPLLLQQLQSRAQADGALSYADYIDTVLYAPLCGYYRQDRQRVGRARSADFYTASSIGSLFAHLALASTRQLLADSTAEFSLVEIGCEPTGSIFRGIEDNPFAQLIEKPLGSAVAIPAQAVLFANEALDAQPFHRLIFQGGQWRERGVRIKGETLEEVLLPKLSPPVRAALHRLPGEMPEGYEFDWPLTAEARLREWIAPIEQGLILCFDYGHTRQTLLRDRPQGTARTYYQHTQGSDLLERPGEQDITCHVCWDDLEAVLRDEGWSDIAVLRQEALFMRYATQWIEQVAQDAAQRGALKELLHPAYLGSSFQALIAKKA